MISRLNVKLLWICLTAVVLGLSACVVPEEPEATTPFRVTVLPEEFSSPLMAPSADRQSSPLAPPSTEELLSSPLPTPSPPTIEGPRGPKQDPGSSEEMNEGQEKAVAVAVKALADRNKVAPDQIELISVKSVQFRDSSLGCPQKGMAYLQVITPGYKVYLRLQGQTYDYRVSRQRAILCQGQR